MIKVIVFGNDSYNSAGTIRCLGEAGYSPTMIVVSQKSRTAVSRSRYIGNYYQVSDVESGVELLMALRVKGIKQYIFATSDKIATVLDREYDDLIDYYIFPNCGGKGHLTEMMDKSTMCQLAAQSGITVPFSVPYKVGESIPDTVVYPCLVKPLKSITGSKQDIKHFASKEELEDYFSENHLTKEFLIQQYIEKEYEILIIGCRTESRKTYLPAYLHVDRSVGEGDVDSAGFISQGLPSTLDSVNIDNFLDKLNYTGPFSIELGFEKGKLYFFEINLRNDGTINYYTKIGVNVPLMWLDNDIKIDNSKPPKAYYIDEFGDFLNVLRGKISFVKWLKAFRKATVFKYYDSKDKGPFKTFAPLQIRIVLSSILRKLTGRL